MDPAIFSFIFGGLQVWHRLFLHKSNASCATQPDDDTRVALAGDRPVGRVNSFAGAEVAARFAVKMERQLAALDPSAARRLTATYDAMEWLFPKVPGEALYIENIVVAEVMRGRDLGRRLIAEAVTKARRLGLRAVHLDTAWDSPAVRYVLAQIHIQNPLHPMGIHAQFRCHDRGHSRYQFSHASRSRRARSNTIAVARAR